MVRHAGCASAPPHPKPRANLGQLTLARLMVQYLQSITTIQWLRAAARSREYGSRQAHERSGLTALLSVRAHLDAL